MKKNELQHSELLAKHFAPRCEEAPMVPVSDIEQRLDEHDMLSNTNHLLTPAFERRGNLFTIRKTIMSLSIFTGLAAIVYFAFFNAPSVTHRINQLNRSYGNHTSPSASTESTPARPAIPDIPEKPSHASTAPRDERGPWSAAGDQIYADLTPDELARMGIVVNGDTVFAYKELEGKPLESIALTMHSIGGGAKNPLPDNARPLQQFPVLMTLRSGHVAAYVREDEVSRFTKEWGMVEDNAMNTTIRDWLQSPGIPGLSPVWWKTTSVQHCDTCETIEKMRLQVGKNFAKQIFPFHVPQMHGFTDSIKAAITQLANYYCGHAEKPNFALPKNLFIAADTVTPQDMLNEMDSEENTSSMMKLRNTMARLNELVPIIVRPHGGSGAPDTNDFIFWYEPSEELFNALPPMQTAAFREKLAEPPHCLTAPNAVLTQAEITYCVDQAQIVDIIVRDLTGKLILSSGDFAHAGDNIFHLNTEAFPSGMYTVTVRDQDSNERTRRIWVENAHPKSFQQYQDDELNHSLKDGLNYRDGSVQASENSVIGKAALPLLKLPDDNLTALGIDNEEFLARFFEYSPQNASKILAVGVERAGGIQIQNVDTIYAPTPMVHFHPQYITNGIGEKRIALGDSTLAVYHHENYEIDRLIPVLLRADNSNDSLSSRDLIFWYAPTPEFLAALPDSARAIAEQMSGTRKSANDTASLVQIHGAIQSASVYPNPSEGKINVNLSLSARRTITITLRNLLGQQAAPPVQAQIIGTGQQSLDFSQVSEGVYLLDITSDQEERYIERVVIAK